jgi:myo-inositol catabolism protein IolC
VALDRDRVYMLAADHRWQWEEWCDANGVPRSRIGETKALALRGFSLAREQSTAVRRFGALLMDQQYGAAPVAQAIGEGIEVGTPAEKGGVFPLEWASEPFSRGLDGSFVKVLVRHRADHPAAMRDGHISKLLTLQQWCREAGKTLVAEVVVPIDGEEEAAFEASGRPEMVASFIRDCYARGVAPEFWKIEGSASEAGARTIDAAIRERPECRQLILGKAADFDTIRGWFAAARCGETAVGFAIGRSVYWPPCTEFLLGKTGDADAIARIASGYLTLISAWES